MLIDTHIHLYDSEFDHDRDLLLQLADNAGITKFLLPNIDASSIDAMLAVCHSYPGSCFPMFGLHPCSVKADFENELETVHTEFLKNKNKTIAIGEIGLDFHWDITFRSQQEEAFRIQVGWASEHDLPIVIHSRESIDAIVKILNDINLSVHRGVFHCFSGNDKQAEQITEMGYMLGIGGVVTFKNSGLDKVLSSIPMSKIVLETDGPYLAPVPFRGKRNEPSYLKLTAERVAEIKNLSLEEVAVQTTNNAMQLFQLARY